MSKKYVELGEIQTGPEAEWVDPVEFSSETAARVAYLERVEQFLADGAAVRLHGPSSCTATLRQDGQVVVQAFLSVEAFTEPSDAWEYAWEEEYGPGGDIPESYVSGRRYYQ